MEDSDTKASHCMISLINLHERKSIEIECRLGMLGGEEGGMTTGRCGVSFGDDRNALG